MMFEQLLTGRNLMLAGAIFVIMTIIKTPFKPFWDSHWGQRLLPILPVLLGIGGGFAGICDCAKWQDKLVIGIIAGFFAANVFKVGKTSVLGYGIPAAGGDAPEAPATPVPAPTPAPAPTVPAATPAADKKE